MAYHRNESNSNLKIVLVALVILTSVVSFTAFNFYSKTLEQSATISVIQSDLANKTVTIEGLEKQIGSLSLDIKTKESLITYLGDKLQLTQQEVQGLTPVIKRYYAAAVREDGTGSIIPFEVKLVKGTGAISVNIKNVAPLTGVQDSLRTAAKVAEGFTGMDMSEKDIDVTFINEGSEIVTVDGPSAGAAMTVTIIAALENKAIGSEVFMTGTINEDNTVGPVGGIAQKAAAARDFGAKIFLVPQGQKSQVTGIEVAEYSNIVSAVSLVLK